MKILIEADGSGSDRGMPSPAGIYQPGCSDDEGKGKEEHHVPRKTIPPDP